MLIQQLLSSLDLLYRSTRGTDFEFGGFATDNTTGEISYFGSSQFQNALKTHMPKVLKHQM